MIVYAIRSWVIARAAIPPPPPPPQVLLALLHPGDEDSVNAFWYVLARIANDHTRRAPDPSDPLSLEISFLVLRCLRYHFYTPPGRKMWPTVVLRAGGGFY